MSLARTILLFDWRRFLPALLSVTFAGVLMLVQLGLLVGMFGTVTVLADRMSASLWITAAATQSLDQSADIPASLAALVRAHPDLIRSETLLVRDGSWRSGRGSTLPVTLVGITPAADALTCPQPLQAALCAALSEPGSVVVDQSEADKLGATVAGLIEINGHRLRIAGLSQGMRSIGTTYVFASQQTLRDVLDRDADDRSLTTFVLAQTRAEVSAVVVADELQQLLPAKTAKAWTREQLSQQSQRWWLQESGVGAGFLFSTVLGLLIAVVITSQTLRGVVLSQLREYATFRAIGIPASKLGAVIVEQALWIGLAGGLLMLGLVAVVAQLAQHFFVPFALSGVGVAVAMAVGLVTAIGSGLLALRELYRLQPAELLR